MRTALNRFGRGLGVLCAVTLAGAWAFTLWVPTAGLTLSGISVVMALLLVIFALFAGIAAFHGHAVVVVLFFLASFFPIGAFLMPTDHWLRWVGWIDLGLLGSALLLWATREPAAQAAPGP
jgi:ABC-type glycerol-3-phosphate transport system permease component